MKEFFDNWTRRIEQTSIIFRLLVFVVLPMFVVIGLTAAYLLNTLEQRFERRMEEDVEMVARSLQLPVSHALERRRPGSLGKSLESAIRIGRVYGVRLYDRSGDLIISTVKDEEANGRTDDDDLKIEDPDERRREYGTVAGESAYSYFVPLFGSADQTIGFMQVSRRKRDFNQLMSRLRWMGLGVALLVVLLVSGVALGGYYHAVGRALGRLRESMRRIERGDHDHRADVTGPRELATVARSLNAMLDSLQDAERRVARQHRQKADLKDELRESEKMAAVGRVSAGVAHELGNPLSTLMGHLQRLRRQTDGDDDERARSIEVMSRETDRMESIIQQMLDFGRSSSTDPSTISPEQSVKLCRSRLIQIAGEHDATLEFAPPDAPGDARLEVSTARLEQALVNLVANASRAARERVRLAWRIADGYVEYRVGDDGSGVDAEIRDELFEPFVTTEADHGGAGLGLAIVEAVAREHDGYATLDASPMGGAQFRLGLPLKGHRS